jgi:hypothetical protein
LPVVLSCRAGDPCGKVVHERDGSPVAVNSSLYQIGVKEEEQYGG